MMFPRRFMKALEVRGLSRDDLPYKAPFQPWGAWLAFGSTGIITLFKGFDTFLPWNAANFVTYAIFRSILHINNSHHLVAGATLQSLFSLSSGSPTSSYSKPRWLNLPMWTLSQECVRSMTKRRNSLLTKKPRDRAVVLRKSGTLCKDDLWHSYNTYYTCT